METTNWDEIEDEAKEAGGTGFIIRNIGRSFAPLVSKDGFLSFLRFFQQKG